MSFRDLKKTDPEVAKFLASEIERQKNTIDLCASANRASKAVLAASGSVFSDKPSEGYPGRRYHGGCRYIDEIEKLAIERAKHLFSCDHVNVQPHSGSNANLSIFFAALKPGDSVLSMMLNHGGHLSHGHSVNISGKFYNPVFYRTCRETGLIDFDEMEKLAKEHRPKLIIAGATSYPRIIDFKRFKEIADLVGAYLLADICHIGGLVAGGVHPNPFPWCDFAVVTNYKTLPGSRGGMVMCKKEFAKMVDKAVFPGTQGGMIASLITAKAVALKEALRPEFKTYQQQIVANAKMLAKELMDFGYKLVTEGTDTHLMVVDLSDRNITGKDAQYALEKAGITLDKNLIPYDTKPAILASGIRIGLSVVTSQGMREPEMQKIAVFIDKVLTNMGNDATYREVRKDVRTLCGEFQIDR